MIAGPMASPRADRGSARGSARGRFGVRVVLGAAAGTVLGLASCDLHHLESPGALVPPTAAEDPRLPQLAVTVAGRDRVLHLRTFGDPLNPALLVLPGGPGSDFRLLLPLEALSDQYHVVMWDPRGAGLSERTDPDELSLDSFVEEIAAVRAAVAPSGPVTLAGHSYGAGLMLRYAIRHPDISQLVLIEPGPLTPEGRRRYRGGAVRWADGQDFFWQNEFLSSRDHAAADYKGISLIPLASRSFTCSGAPPATYPMWRFGAYHYHVVTHGPQAPAPSFDWTEGFDGTRVRADVLAGTCGAADADFQRAFNLDALPGVPLTVVQGAGHISLFTTHAEQTLAALRTMLDEYR